MGNWFYKSYNWLVDNFNYYYYNVKAFKRGKFIWFQHSFLTAGRDKVTHTISIWPTNKEWGKRKDMDK